MGKTKRRRNPAADMSTKDLLQLVTPIMAPAILSAAVAEMGKRIQRLEEKMDAALSPKSRRN